MTTQARPTIDANMDPRQLVFLAEREAKLADLLNDMQASEYARNVKRRALSVLNEELSALSDDVRQQVNDEVCDNGKPRYTNAEARAVAASKLMRDHPQARVIVGRIADLDAEIDELSMEFDAARRDRQSIHSVLEFSAAWLGWYSTSGKERE